MASTNSVVSVNDNADPSSDMALLRTLHTDGSVQCKKCSKFYENTKNWEYHYYHYHRKLPNMCHESNCDFRYLHKCEIVKHAVEDHDKTLCYCNICDKIIGNNFISHTREIHSTFPSNENSLADQFITCVQNVRRCADEEQKEMVREIKYKCDKCVELEYKSFATIDELFSHHRDIHVSPVYACPVCDNVSPTLFDADEHMYNHYEAKPFSCQECSIRFATQNLFNLHNRRHHDEALFQCPECTCSYIYFSDLKKHRRRQHANQLSK